MTGSKRPLADLLDEAAKHVYSRAVKQSKTSDVSLVRLAISK